MSSIQRIRQKIIDRAYYLLSHAEDEMVEDGNLIVITVYALTEE